MSKRAIWPLAIIFFALGAAISAAVLIALPDPGSPPSIFDDFNWSSTANGFWHVNEYGATDRIAHGTMRLAGESIELDHRVQTDPRVMVTSMRVRARRLDKFGFGLGVYHSGTIGMEFDADGLKCGRGTDHGYQVDVVDGWKPQNAPLNQWFYLEMDVVNPYPNPKDYERLATTPDKIKPVTERCLAYDSSGRLIAEVIPTDPQPNTHYVSLDEAYIRTWDDKNDYDVDWFYSGPARGNPLNGIVHRPAGH